MVVIVTTNAWQIGQSKLFVATFNEFELPSEIFEHDTHPTQRRSTGGHLAASHRTASTGAAPAGAGLVSPDFAEQPSAPGCAAPVWPDFASTR